MRSIASRTVSEAARSAVLALIRERVVLRFALTGDALADRVIALVSTMATDPARWHAHASRLVLDDLYLAMACAAGEHDAWRELERTHFPFIRDFARRFLTETQAEDLAADVIADLWQRGKIARFEGRSTLRTWLGAVVTRAALNVRASRKAAVVSLESESGALNHQASAGIDEDGGATLARWVRTALDRLGPDDKLLLLFHYEHGLSLDEMAPLLRASKATLSRRLARVRERVRDAVSAIAIEEGGPRGAESVRSAIDRAPGELDLAAVLGAGAVVRTEADEIV